VQEKGDCVLAGIRIGITVPIRRNLTGNALANGNGTDTERVQECDQKGYRMGTEWIQDGNGNACGTETERVLSTFPC